MKCPAPEHAQHQHGEPGPVRLPLVAPTTTSDTIDANVGEPCPGGPEKKRSSSGCKTARMKTSKQVLARREFFFVSCPRRQDPRCTRQLAGSKRAPATQGLWAEQGSEQLDGEAGHAGCREPDRKTLVCLTPACWNSRPVPSTQLGRSSEQPSPQGISHRLQMGSHRGQDSNAPAISQLCCCWMGTHRAM